MTDGVSLQVQFHPKQGLMKRFIFWLFRRRLNPDSLEEIEIELPDE